jgi:hypothetical protein
MYRGFLELLFDSVLVWAIAKSRIGVDKNGRGQGWMPWAVFA